MPMKKALLAAVALSLASPAAALAEDKVSITVNIVQLVGKIDPAVIGSYTEYMAAVNFYDGLTTVAPSGEIIPQLAESWSVSEDNLTYTFNLKKGATFQNGDPVKASDVVYSLNRLVAINKGPSYLFSGLIAEDGVKALDDHTVSITLNKVYAPFLSNTPLILVVNEAQAKANATAEDEWAELYVGQNPIGAGPYSLSSWNRGSEMIMARNVNYHEGWSADKKPIDEVRFVITRDEATVRALATRGELAFSSQYQANETYDAIGKMKGYDVLELDTASNLYIKLNHQKAPTDDVHVRRALAYALDYSTVRELIFPSSDLNGPLAASFADAYNFDLPAVEFNLEKAEEELKKSKYYGNGPIKLDHVYADDTPVSEEIGLLSKAILDSIGFEVDLRPEPWTRMTELAANPETTPNATQIYQGPSYPSPDAVFFVSYHSKAAGTWASTSWVNDPKVDGLIEKARGQTNPDEQNATYKELQAYLVDQQSDIYVGTQKRQHARSVCLQGFEYIPMQSWDHDFSRLWWDCSAK
nr:ABC transporter substrate-binding protein [Pseudovibrio flavus]